MKLALGTVQFGLDYGISNETGKISQQEINKILDYSQRNNINTLDTASGYGNSESAIGNANQLSTSPFEIITKIAVNEYCPTYYEQQLTLSLKRLQRSSVYAVMLHNANDLLSSNAKQKYNELISLKHKGLCKKIGVSVYQPEQLLTIINDFDIDIVQVPLNIFDQRFSCQKIKSALQEKTIEVHARSLFLQGLLFMNKLDRPKFFAPYSSAFEEFSENILRLKLSPLEACLSFAKGQSFVDEFVIGVSSLTELQQIIATFNEVSLCDFSQLSRSEQGLINPSLWKL
ncbi:MAG: hypothetical protein GY787_05915 [Alteromonadales bacterium]|nr:hypothetical protein [Alteromonadales bacterium]MCP4989670.1 hypothetical protein [Colwellia sp.]